MKSLAELYIVQEITRQLRNQRVYTLVDLAGRIDTQAHKIAPVLWEMQRAGIIETKTYPYTTAVYYQLKEHDEQRQPTHARNNAADAGRRT